MNATEDEAKKLYEVCLSGSVEELDALVEKDQLILNRFNSTACFFNDTPLHVAVLCGHLDFTRALLRRKPKLATELDSQRRSPLHIASTDGHFEIVHELLRVNTDVCISRDQDGRIPLHLATMKGRVEIIWELLGAKPDSVHDKLGRGETVLHLSVKYNRLVALKTLVKYLQSNGMESLINSRDDDGNTILHLAAGLKQMDTIEYLLGIKSVTDHVNVKNQNGSTALDVVEHCLNRDLKAMEIREILMQAGVRRPEPKPESPLDHNPPPPQRCCKAGVALMGYISRFWTTYFKTDPAWLEEIRGQLITAAALTATMAYQSILSPPGGLWQDTNSDHRAGEAVLQKGSVFNPFGAYLVLNTIVLGASLSTIVLAMTGIPMKNKFLTWLLVFTVYIIITCTGYAYLIAVSLVSPGTVPEDVLVGVLYGLLGLCAFVVAFHLCRFLVWLGNKFIKLVKACCTCCRPTPRAYDKNTSEDNLASSSHKCVENFC